MPTKKESSKDKTVIVAIIGALATIIVAFLTTFQGPLIARFFQTPAPTVTMQDQASPTESSTLISPTEMFSPIHPNPSPGLDLQRGSTIEHVVTPGESLLQIARCYGVDFEQLRDANPQISDPGSFLPDMTIIVPNIGSAGEIYGPPCVAYYVLKSGDTLESIASLYNANLTVLRAINKDATFEVGQLLVIPSNSAGATPPPSDKLIKLAPYQDVAYGYSIPPGQVMTVTITTTPSNESVVLRVDDSRKVEEKEAYDIDVWGYPNAESGNYEIRILNKTTSTITYTVEVDFSG